LAAEHGLSAGYLYEILRDKCGDEWVIEFKSKKLNIHERVPMTVPRLLEEETIQAILARLKANSTYLHGNPKHDYLFNGYIFCELCGASLTGQTNPNGLQYYRHPDKIPCELPKPRAWVPVGVIENAVLGQLFDTLGNPAAIEKAIKRAVPDCDKAIKERSRLEAELERTTRTKNQILDLMERGRITMAEVDSRLVNKNEQEAAVREKLNRIAATLANLPKAGRP
jgi:hypothetical protein